MTMQTVKSRYEDAAEAPTISRRSFLSRTAALAAASVLGCTPMRIAFKCYPREFRNENISEAILRAFVSTVIPGAPADAPDLTRVYFDSEYPLAPHVGYLTSDLSQRGAELFGVARFDALDRAQRTRVIEHGLHADSWTRRLYNGAILLAQVSFYAGIYDDTAGCALIGFDGAYQPRPISDLTYPNPGRYFALCATASGNPA